jgi:hypothetical protein
MDSNGHQTKLAWIAGPTFNVAFFALLFVGTSLWFERDELMRWPWPYIVATLILRAGFGAGTGYVLYRLMGYLRRYTRK